jgi:hypothetical protein
LTNFSKRYVFIDIFNNIISFNDISGKLAAGVVDTGGNLPTASLTRAANLPPVSLTPVATGGKFATGVNNTRGTGGKFAAGVVDTGGKFAAGVVKLSL